MSELSALVIWLSALLGQGPCGLPIESTAARRPPPMACPDDAEDEDDDDDDTDPLGVDRFDISPHENTINNGL